MVDDPLLNAWLQETAKQPIETMELREQRKIILDFLDVLDSMDRLVALAKPTSTMYPATNWLEHLRTLRGQMLEVFRCAGVGFFECVGQRFDPSRHEATETVRRQGLDDYTVVEELARGCEWRGQILRFARVVVVRSPD